MTNLTDKWKKGELPSGRYWVMLDVYEDGEFELSDIQISNGNPVGWYDESVKEVIAQVPSYNEWQAKLEENTKLKELLGECLAHLSNGELGLSVTPLNFVIEKIKEVLK